MTQERDLFVHVRKHGLVFGARDQNQLQLAAGEHALQVFPFAFATRALKRVFKTFGVGIAIAAKQESVKVIDFFRIIEPMINILAFQFATEEREQIFVLLVGVLTRHHQGHAVGTIFFDRFAKFKAG